MVNQAGERLQRVDMVGRGTNVGGMCDAVFLVEVWGVSFCDRE